MKKDPALIKKIDSFRKGKGNRFYEIIYEQRKLKRQYIYQRGSEDYDDIMLIKIGDNDLMGLGECSPFPSFFEWPIEKVWFDLINIADLILDNEDLNSFKSTIASPAMSAIDLANIDLKCLQEGKSVYHLFNLDLPIPVTISHTVEYESIQFLENRLKDMGQLPLLKVKLGSDGLDEQRLELVHQLAPKAEIIVDVNEGWTFEHLKTITPILLNYNVKMIEQPLKCGQDTDLLGYHSPIPIYADESFKSYSDLERLNFCYDGFNIKLDKIGGLTKALTIIEECKRRGKGIMVGCLGGTSRLSSAGFVAAQYANFVDLDNHLWLCQDHNPSLGGIEGIIEPPGESWYWGTGNSLNRISVY